MEFDLTTATWFWLMIPMPLLILLSGFTYYIDKKERITEHDC